ncbi:hypothetical protein R1flu_000258 [Riccia fluitans]|uniref:Uncharacterized protein n=1 Tax=Riccia fluitans TaxID=41844 RepID=A0ABD1XZX6_9MARC
MRGDCWGEPSVESFAMWHEVGVDHCVRTGRPATTLFPYVGHRSRGPPVHTVRDPAREQWGCRPYSPSPCHESDPVRTEVDPRWVDACPTTVANPLTPVGCAVGAVRLSAEFGTPALPQLKGRTRFGLPNPEVVEASKGFAKVNVSLLRS